MSTPAPREPITQVRYPWKATLRTLVQVAIPWILAAPLLVQAIEGDQPGQLGWIGTAAVAASTALGRLMAVPIVNATLTRWGLGATPPPPPMDK